MVGQSLMLSGMSVRKFLLRRAAAAGGRQGGEFRYSKLVEGAKFRTASDGVSICTEPRDDELKLTNQACPELAVLDMGVAHLGWRDLKARWFKLTARFLKAAQRACIVGNAGLEATHR
jgi:hypothetical protein